MARKATAPAASAAVLAVATLAVGGLALGPGGAAAQGYYGGPSDRGGYPSSGPYGGDRFGQDQPGRGGGQSYGRGQGGSQWGQGPGQGFAGDGMSSPEEQGVLILLIERNRQQQAMSEVRRSLQEARMYRTRIPGQ